MPDLRHRRTPLPKVLGPMSNHAHRRPRRRRKVDPSTLAAMTAITSAARGCTCHPDIATRHTPHGPETTVAHDDWCPAANTGTAIGIVPPPHAQPRRHHPPGARGHRPRQAHPMTLDPFFPTTAHHDTLHACPVYIYWE